MRLLPVCEAEILQVKLKLFTFSHLFMLISDEFWLEVQKIAKKGYLGFLLKFLKTDKL